jgi:uncharacterized glyoxalase superfamily metalloenzyme YdcJ
MDMTTIAEPKITVMPGAALSAQVLLAKTVERLEEIDAVIVISKDRDGVIRVGWSRMSLSELALALRVFERDVDREIGRLAE